MGKFLSIAIFVLAVLCAMVVYFLAIIAVLVIISSAANKLIS